MNGSAMVTPVIGGRYLGQAVYRGVDLTDRLGLRRFKRDG